MILPFNPQFKPLILDGTKIHTIREDKHDRWKVGMKIHMATGVRTKNYKQFAEATVSRIVGINIKWFLLDHKDNIVLKNDQSRCPSVNLFEYYGDLGENYYESIIFHKHCNPKLMNELAKNDGFNSIDDFFGWFNTDFKGKLIYWEKLKIIE